MNRTQRRAAMRQNHFAPTNDPPPPSAAQLAANRANSQHSTGPVTPEGRARSSQNRTTHGLARHNKNFQVLASEDQNGFEALKQSLAADYEPTSEPEFQLINETAENLWLIQRARNFQNTCFDPVTSEIIDAKKFDLYLRYETTHANQYHKCLNALLKISAQREKRDNGFEAQRRKDEELRIKTERHEIKKQAKETETPQEQTPPPSPKTIEFLNFMKSTACDPKLATDIAAYLKKLGHQEAA